MFQVITSCKEQYTDNKRHHDSVVFKYYTVIFHTMVFKFVRSLCTTSLYQNRPALYITKYCSLSYVLFHQTSFKLLFYCENHVPLPLFQDLLTIKILFFLNAAVICA